MMCASQCTAAGPDSRQTILKMGWRERTLTTGLSMALCYVDGLKIRIIGTGPPALQSRPEGSKKREIRSLLDSASDSHGPPVLRLRPEGSKKREIRSLLDSASASHGPPALQPRPEGSKKREIRSLLEADSVLCARETLFHCVPEPTVPEPTVPELTLFRKQILISLRTEARRCRSRRARWFAGPVVRDRSRGPRCRRRPPSFPCGRQYPARSSR